MSVSNTMIFMICRVSAGSISRIGYEIYTYRNDIVYCIYNCSMHCSTKSITYIYHIHNVYLAIKTSPWESLINFMHYIWNKKSWHFLTFNKLYQTLVVVLLLICFTNTLNYHMNSTSYVVIAEYFVVWC